MLDIARWRKLFRCFVIKAERLFLTIRMSTERFFLTAMMSTPSSRLLSPTFARGFPFLMGEHFSKGAEHIQEEIHKLFLKQQHGDSQEVDDSQRISNIASERIPIAVGIYDVGGSGKTTVCRYMLNFYNKEYPGNCCFIQFPSKEADISLLVQSLRDVLSNRGSLANITIFGMQSVEEVMSHIQELSRAYRVFLVVDNVCNWSLDIAMAILKTEFMLGSWLLVTARSEALLQTLSSKLGFFNHEGGRNLPAMQIAHVPSISEEEAIEALKAYNVSSLQYSSTIEDLRGLARSCFYAEQCHPLLLKIVGTKLRYQGGQAHSAQDWTRITSNLQACVIHGDEEVDDMIMDVLKTSYDLLRSKLKKTILKLGTCIPKDIIARCKLLNSESSQSLTCSISKWLSKVSDDGSDTVEDIRDQLMELKYHGLIQIHGEDVAIHDAQMMMIENLVRENKGAPRCFFFEGDLRTLSARECTRLKYIYGEFETVASYDISSDLQFMIGPSIEVLRLGGKDWSSKKTEYKVGEWLFAVKHMQCLRHLCFNSVSLRVLDLTTSKDLKRVEGSVCGLTALEELVEIG